VDEDEDEWGDVCEPVAARFSRWDVAIAVFGMFMGIFHAISSCFESLLQASVAAANKEIRDDRFHQEAALEIETLTGGEEDG
jgi:hypothetical protein